MAAKGSDFNKGDWGRSPQQDGTWTPKSMLAKPENLQNLEEPIAEEFPDEAAELESRKSEKGKRRRPFRVTVRLTPEEWARLERDEVLRGRKKARLLRDAYMGRLELQPIMSHEQAEVFNKAVARISNNVNQIAKHANSGELVSREIHQEVVESLRALLRFGLRQNGGR